MSEEEKDESLESLQRSFKESMKNGSELLLLLNKYIDENKRLKKEIKDLKKQLDKP